MNIKNVPIKERLKKPQKKNLRKILFGVAGIIFIAIIIFMISVFQGLPSLEELENPRSQLASNVWSRDGELLGSFFIENRMEVSIDSLPPHVVNALISTEDKNFYHHWGVDLQRFIKAMIKNVFLFKREGASTITQQLAKNLYELKVRHESTFGTVKRKVQEWITAIQIERTYTKREILEMYFNTSYFGHSAYGISTAARTYFDKNVKQLSVTDAGVLIALLKGSGKYDPFDKYENAFRRRNIVLQNMTDDGLLSEQEFNRLKLEPIKLSYKRIELGVQGSIAPHFLEYIRKQMETWCSKHGANLYSDGLNITTTIDSRMQKIANNAAKVHLETFQKQFDKFWNWNKNASLLNEMIDKAIKGRHEYREAENDAEKRSVYNELSHSKNFIDSVKNVGKKIEVGFICIDPKSGEIRAMIGGREQNFGRGLNHVTQIRRQPGSSFKPIVYSVAIDNGLYPAYPIMNQRFSINDGSNKAWSPTNFDGSESGWTTLRYALLESLNIVAARLIIEDHAQLWKIGQFAEKLGIKGKLDLVPSIALGSSVVSPIELTSAYATLANRGIYNEPISILKIEDKDGVLVENFTTSTREAIPEETAFIVTDMLRSAIDEGTSRGARSIYNFRRPAAGKTGTNQDFADAWYMGYTPQLAAGVWVGFDDQRVSFTGSYGQGAVAAMPIWAIFMHDVYEQMNLPLEDFAPPESGNIVPVQFCKESIYKYGNPRRYSSDCSGGSLTDIVNIKDMPAEFRASIDTTYKYYDRYKIKDTVSHEAKEIR